MRGQVNIKDENITTYHVFTSYERILTIIALQESLLQSTASTINLIGFLLDFLDLEKVQKSREKTIQQLVECQNKILRLRYKLFILSLGSK